MDLLKIAIEASLEAGKNILSVYNSNDFNVELKGDNSPLTLADKQSHLAIIKFLEPTQIPIISEEAKEIPYKDRKDWTTFWMVDPLDGTKEFIKRNGEFTVNIALIENGKPTLGVIYVPVTNTLYFTENGNSYKIDSINDIKDWNNSKKKQLVKKEPTPDVVVVASRSHLSPETVDFISRIEEMPSIYSVETISAGSSLKLCMVAEGEADVYPRFAPTMEWDVAAGHAICNGAKVRVLQTGTDTELKYNKENLLNPWFVVGDRFGS